MTALTAIRAAYFMKNLPGSLGMLGQGVLPTFVPRGPSIPTVATRDIGKVAAASLESPRGDVRIELAGPRDDSADDVAAPLSKLTGRAIAATDAPIDAVVPTFTSFGQSPGFAGLYRELFAGSPAAGPRSRAAPTARRAARSTSPSCARCWWRAPDRTAPRRCVRRSLARSAHSAAARRCGRWHTRRVLVRPHVSIMGARRIAVTQPDAKLLEDVVAEKVLAAWRTAAAALERAGVPYILIGGLAVGANGHPRATKDVDFLVGEGAFIQHGGGVVTMNPALPIQINGVAIDYLSPREGEGHLAAALVGPPGRVLDAPRLVYMKLRASRFQDKADIASLVKAGTDVDSCRTYLVAHAPELLALFDSIVTAAIAEE